MLFPPNSTDVREIGSAAASYLGLKGVWKLFMHREEPRPVIATLMKVICSIIPEVAVHLELKVDESEEYIKCDFTRAELCELL